jgi:hypothetical protein
MSATTGDKARFHRERKGKIARRERGRILRKKIADAAAVAVPAVPTGAQL